MPVLDIEAGFAWEPGLTQVLFHRGLRRFCCPHPLPSRSERLEVGLTRWRFQRQQATDMEEGWVPCYPTDGYQVSVSLGLECLKLSMEAGCWQLPCTDGHAAAHGALPSKHIWLYSCFSACSAAAVVLHRRYCLQAEGYTINLSPVEVRVAGSMVGVPQTRLVLQEGAASSLRGLAASGFRAG